MRFATKFPELKALAFCHTVSSFVEKNGTDDNNPHWTRSASLADWNQQMNMEQTKWRDEACQTTDIALPLLKRWEERESKWRSEGLKEQEEEREGEEMWSISREEDEEEGGGEEGGEEEEEEDEEEAEAEADAEAEA